MVEPCQSTTHNLLCFRCLSDLKTDNNKDSVKYKALSSVTKDITIS